MTVARVRVMYWKEIPIQVQAQDENGQVSKLLDDRFQKGADMMSMFDGSSGTDEYLNAWEWSDYTDMDGSAEDAAARIAEGFNKGFPEDFVGRIRELHRSGRRDPRPRAIDHWIRE